MDLGIATIISSIISPITTALITFAITKINTQKSEEAPKCRDDDINTYIKKLNDYNKKLEEKLSRSKKLSLIASVISIISVVFLVIYLIFGNNIFITKDTDKSVTDNIADITTDITVEDNPYQAPVIKVNSKISSIESATLKGSTITIKIKKDDLFSEGKTKRGIILYSPQYNTPYNNEKVLVLEAELNEEANTLKTQVVIRIVTTDGYSMYKTLSNYSSGTIHDDVCELAFDITNDYTDTDDIYIYNLLNHR